MIYAIDIDDTLCTPKEGHYSKYEPDIRAIAKVNQLYEQGNTIKIFTARGAASGIDWRETTEKNLKDWGIKYHELLMTKPHADIFIDDKAINTRDWLQSNKLVMVVGERGSGKSTVKDLFQKRGFVPVDNDLFYQRYKDENHEETDKVYEEVESTLLIHLETSNVVYAATGRNNRWHILRDKLSLLYSTVVVKVSSSHSSNRCLERGWESHYPSSGERLEAIKDALDSLDSDFDIVNNETIEELDIQVEGIVQKLGGSKLVAVSGAFDPIRSGHIRYFKEARKLGRLVVMMRNNASILLKKGYIFMPDETERKEVLESIRYVNAVVVTIDKDQTSNKTLELLRPDIYAKGGDRKGRSEAEACEKVGCEIITGIVPTYTSSSELVERIRNLEIIRET